MESQGLKDKKRFNKMRIAKYVLQKGEASKPEIASALQLSMPTVLQNVKEMVADQILEESGVYESTGGRKAKALTVVCDRGYSVGIDITANHISYVLIDLKGSILEKQRIRKEFSNDLNYYKQAAEGAVQFVEEGCAARKKDRILGAGISVPGIVDREQAVLLRSHILGVENLNLRTISQWLPWPADFANDANSAAMAELNGLDKDAVYLSLSNTVGGAVYLHGEIYQGKHFRGGEFGHMILVPGGRRCYCGKAGCVDAYCSAKILSGRTGGNLEAFFEQVREGNGESEQVWEEYLEYLAMAVTNLRMAFDCDVVLGGYVGGCMEPYMMQLSEKIMKYNTFDQDALYVCVGKYKREASAVGIAMSFVEKYFEELL